MAGSDGADRPSLGGGPVHGVGDVLAAPGVDLHRGRAVLVAGPVPPHGNDSRAPHMLPAG